MNKGIVRINHHQVIVGDIILGASHSHLILYKVLSITKIGNLKVSFYHSDDPYLVWVDCSSLEFIDSHNKIKYLKDYGAFGTHYYLVKRLNV